MKPFRCLLPLAGCCLTGLALMSAESAAPSAPLGTTVFDFDQLPAKSTGMGFFRRVTDQPTATLHKLEFHITTLNSGHLSHPPHHHPQEELIILKEGTLDVFINGRTQRVGPGSAFFFASHDVHNVASVGDGPATYYVINFATAKTAAVPDRPAAESAAPGTLPSSVFDWEKLTAEPMPYGIRRKIFDSPTVTLERAEIHATTLNPGQDSPHGAHNHPDEGLVIVKDGKPDLILNGNVTHAHPGTIAYIASDQSLRIKNPTDAPVSYYVLHYTTPLTPKDVAVH